MNFGLWWVKPAIYAIFLAVLFGGFTMFVSHERSIGAAAKAAAMQKSYDQGVAKAAADAKTLFMAQQSAADKAHVQDVQRSEVQAQAVSVSRAELARLRLRLASASPAASSPTDPTGPSTDATAVAYRLLSECSGRYEEVAGDAGRYANQVIGLQGFVRADQIGDGGPPVGVDLRAGRHSLVTQPTTARAELIRGAAVPPTPEGDS